MTWTDKFTKRVLLIAGHSEYKAEDWAKKTLRMVLISRWSLPKRIISDRDVKFTSHLWTAMFENLGIQQATIVGYR